MILLVPAYPGCPGQTAVKWLLLLLELKRFQKAKVTIQSPKVVVQTSGEQLMEVTGNICAAQAHTASGLASGFATHF